MQTFIDFVLKTFIDFVLTELRVAKAAKPYLYMCPVLASGSSGFCGRKSLTWAFVLQAHTPTYSDLAGCQDAKEDLLFPAANPNTQLYCISFPVTA